MNGTASKVNTFGKSVIRSYFVGWEVLLLLLYFFFTRLKYQKGKKTSPVIWHCADKAR